MNLERIQTTSGKITIAAFDQRGSLMKILGLEHDKKESAEKLTKIKTIFMETFSPLCSGVLVDPDYGLPTLEKKDSHAGLLMTLEGYDYVSEDKEGMPPMNPNWGVLEIAAKHAAVKFFMFFNPRSAAAQQKIELIDSISNQSGEFGLPFIFEPILYPVPGHEESFSREMFELYQETVEIFTTRCDVLKLEFPILPSEELNESLAAERCQKISELATVPWVLLSRGMVFERYIRSLEIAMKNGASGFAVGRAVWKEVGTFSLFEEQENFIRTVAKDRMKALVNVVESA